MKTLMTLVFASMLLISFGAFATVENQSYECEHANNQQARTANNKAEERSLESQETQDEPEVNVERVNS